MTSLHKVHKALQKKREREMTTAFVCEIEDKVREQIGEEAKEKAIAFWIDKIEKGLAKQMELVMLLVLHDNRGFGPYMSVDTFLKFEEMWNDVQEKHLTLEDIEDVVREELRMEFDDASETVWQILKNGKKKQIWPKKEELTESIVGG